MPTWLISVLEWAIGMLLQHLNTSQAKGALADLIARIDDAVQAEDARVSGPFKGIADEVAAAFHTSAVAIEAALKS